MIEIHVFIYDTYKERTHPLTDGIDNVFNVHIMYFQPVLLL